MPRQIELKSIHAGKDERPVIGMLAKVAIVAAAGDDGETKKPATFSVTAYTGGELSVRYWDHPVVIDLQGLEFSRSVVANLDHVESQRVGHVTEKAKTESEIQLSGTFSAATTFRDEVVNSAADGFEWEASVEVDPTQLLEVEAGESITVNGKEVKGPVYVAVKSELTGFGFVSHGADRSTTVSIAASKSKKAGIAMDEELKAFIKDMGFTPEDLSETQIAAMKASFEGKGTPAPVKRPKLTDGIEARQAESDRVDNIVDIALAACDKRPYDMEAIKSLAEQGIEAKWPVEKFRLELLEASLPPAHTVFRTKGDDRLNTRVLEAAVCMAGKLKDHEKRFDDQTLQAAHDRFPGGIGLKQLFLLAARTNGYNSDSMNVDINVQRAAFGMTGHHSVQASEFSTLSLPTVFSNTANKFLMEGWNAVDMTPLKIAAVRPVSDFKQITTVSLTGDLMFEQVGPDGEIKHGTLGELPYTNKADTYARMLGVTRTDIINDDLGALTAAPRKLGRGGALKLNDLFWAAFLSNATFFTSARKNVSTDTGALGLLGLEQADTIFMDQTDPDGNPLGVMPAILLAPTAAKATALQLMNAEKIKGSTDEPDVNIWRDRFRVESSPYMSNVKYTGNSASAWYLLADPADLPVIEIVALNGRVEPVIETADADFNVLGVQMRGYSDVGVEKQEYRAGVRADGSAAG
jgi:hypothetical protein